MTNGSTFDPADSPEGGAARTDWSEFDHSFLYQSAPILMGEVRLLPDGDILHLHDNPAANAFFGLPPGGSTGRTARAMGATETTISAWRARYEEADREQRAVRFDYGHVSPEGRQSWLSVTVAPIAPDPRGAARFGYVAQDITERKAAEAALAESETLLRLGLSAAQMVTWEVDCASGAISRSANADEVFGPGAVHDEFYARMPPEDAARARAAIARALETPGTPYEVEFRYRHPDGRWMWLHNRGVVLRNASGTPLRVHGVCVDVTRRKEAELALRQMNEQLEAEVARRTEELLQAEDALRQAQKMEALGQLTGGVAHDFNNLLGAVVGSFDLIRQRIDDPVIVQRYVEIGLQAAERGAKLTSQLLAFSRSQRIELRPVDVGTVLGDMHALLERTLGPMIRLDIDPGPGGSVLSDPTQLELAILNLAINSRDAMPHGGTLTIRCAMVAADRFEIAVADTGTGMPPQVVAKAFDPFFTTKGPGKGTGLGLSQVYGIVRQSGGEVRIDSTPGLGTTVRLFLPCSAVRSPADDAMAAQQRWSGGAGTVLVIDDDAAMRATLSDMLELLGFDVVTVADGPAGLAMLGQVEPRVLLVDFAMPAMNGADVATVARQRRPQLPVILCTGYADTGAIEGVPGPRPGMLHKPFRIDDLKAVLSSLGLDAASPPPAEQPAAPPRSEIIVQAIESTDARPDIGK